jgi:hypothetical protein
MRGEVLMIFARLRGSRTLFRDLNAKPLRPSLIEAPLAVRGHDIAASVL